MLPSSWNRKYQPFTLLSFFSLVVCLRCLLHHILSHIACTFRENWDFVLIIIVQFMMTAYSRIRCGLSYSFVCTLHHLIIIIVQTYLQTLNLWNVCQIYFCECVSKIEHILLVIHYSLFGAVCFQFTQFHRDGGGNILLCLIIIINSEVWTIIQCLGLDHETMVCAVCLYIFFLPGMAFCYMFKQVFRLVVICETILLRSRQPKQSSILYYWAIKAHFLQRQGIT